MLTQFLDWLDEVAGGLIRLAYLLAGVSAVAVYFGAGQLPLWIDEPLNTGLPWVLAFAVETHTYLTGRRLRAAWQDRDNGALKVNLAVLAVLLSFQAVNQLGYLGETWRPPTGPFTLPTGLAYAVRAGVIPLAFLAAALLAPVAPPIVAQIEGEARATLADVFRIARRQRKKLLKKAESSGRDLTGALVQLVPDDETRRIIGTAYAAIGAGAQAPQDGASVVLSAPSAVDNTNRSASTERPLVTLQQSSIAPMEITPNTSILPDSGPDSRPPTGGGSPVVASKPRRGNAPAGGKVTPLRKGMGQPPRRDKRTAAQMNARSGHRGTAEARVRAALAEDPSIGFEEVIRRAGVSASSASKWIAVIQAERAAQQAAQ
jgi:hypothetical protein